MTTAGLTFRLARAAAFAVVCLVLGVVAHVAGGGTVSGRAAVFGLVVASLVVLPATGRERGMSVILPLLAGVQVALHLLFSTAPVLEPLVEVGGHVHTGLVPGVGMLVTHGWAVGLTALWLSRGEAALWAVLRRLAVRLRLLVIFVSGRYGPPRTGHAGSPAPAIPRSALLRHAVSGRAPPPALVSA
ncbi:MFS transporter [Sphaerisporangium viridialbum]|uniref:MFS transporter n=1 Tax=Sphaerisporangium viridialbum TaxID=46189 RepID=UPI003C720169